MPPRRGGLGRGLDALIGTSHETPAADGARAAPPPASEAPGAAGTLDVEIGRIAPNPLQPRRQVDPERLEELAQSIREHGVIQPLVVAQAEPQPAETLGARRYVLIAGERRWRAAKLAGLVRVPVVVREAARRDLLEVALVENVQRADLNPLEEAAAYQQLVDEFGLTQEEVGRRAGKSRFAVSNTMRLLHLPAMVQAALLEGQLTEGHARAILMVAGDAEAQRHLAQRVIDEGLSVRQTEEIARRLQAQTRPLPSRRRAHAAGDDVEERFRTLLGTKVSLTRTKRGGRLVIHFYSDDQLQDIYERLTGDE